MPFATIPIHEIVLSLLRDPTSVTRAATLLAEIGDPATANPPPSTCQPTPARALSPWNRAATTSATFAAAVSLKDATSSAADAARDWHPCADPYTHDHPRAICTLGRASYRPI